MNYQWQIVYISDITEVWANNLQKRTVVLEEVTDKDYKWGIAFDLIKDKVTLIDNFKVWDTVDVSLNFKASEYNSRYFTNINAWKITALTEWDGNHAFAEDDDNSLPF